MATSTSQHVVVIMMMTDQDDCRWVALWYWTSNSRSINFIVVFVSSLLMILKLVLRKYGEERLALGNCYSYVTPNCDKAHVCITPSLYHDKPGIKTPHKNGRELTINSWAIHITCVNINLVYSIKTICICATDIHVPYFIETAHLAEFLTITILRYLNLQSPWLASQPSHLLFPVYESWR